MAISNTLIGLAAMAGLACAVPAHAVTTLTQISNTSFVHIFSTTAQYTGNTSASITDQVSPTISIAQFDSRGGRFVLTGVTMTITRTLNAALTFDNGSGNARTGTMSFQLNNTLAGAEIGFSSSVTKGNAALAVSMSGRSVKFDDAQIGTTSSTVFTPASFAPFAGNGTITLSSTLNNFVSQFQTVNGGQGNVGGTAAGSISGDVAVAYSYFDIVPEPDSWAMLIAGFGLTGAAARRRRAVPG